MGGSQRYQRVMGETVTKNASMTCQQKLLQYHSEFGVCLHTVVGTEGKNGDEEQRRGNLLSDGEVVLMVKLISFLKYSDFYNKLAVYVHTHQSLLTMCASVCLWCRWAGEDVYRHQPTNPAYSTPNLSNLLDLFLNKNATISQHLYNAPPPFLETTKFVKIALSHYDKDLFVNNNCKS